MESFIDHPIDALIAGSIGLIDFNRVGRMAGEKPRERERRPGITPSVPMEPDGRGGAEHRDVPTSEETIELASGKSHPTSAREAVPAELFFLSPPELPGEIGRLGHYRVLSLLGEGGMGLVLRAEDERLKREIAIKVMRPTVASHPQARERFMREAQAAAAIEHDNVVGIHQVGEINGIPFIAMPLLKGESLKARLERVGRLDEGDAMKIGYQVAAALASAHAKGLVHRDIKPDNIWIEGKTGRVKVLDFGLARVAFADPGLTQDGSVLGTPLFMSPEQARGEEIDARSDLYSLGAVLYNALSGRPVVSGSSLPAILVAVVNESPPPLRSLVARIDPDVAGIVELLLAKDRESRPASAVETAKRFGEIIKQRRSGKLVGRDQTVAGEGSSMQAAASPSGNSVAASTAHSDTGTATPRGRRVPTWAIAAGCGVFFAAILGLVVRAPRSGDVERNAIRATDGVPISVAPQPVAKVEMIPRGRDGQAVSKNHDNVATDQVPTASVQATNEVGHARTPRADFLDAERQAVEWILSVGGEVHVVDAVGRGIDVKSMSDLPLDEWFAHSVSLQSADKTKVNDDSIQNLAPLSKIVSLNLAGLPLSDRGLSILDGFPFLEHLALVFVGVGDATASRIAKLDNLKILNLGHTAVTDAGFTLICEHLRGLKDVALSPVMSDASVIAAAELPGLTQLGMKQPHATHRAFESLRAAKTLEGLHVVSATDEIVRECASLTQVGHLAFDLLQVSPEVIRTLAALGRLEDLNVSDSPEFKKVHLDVVAELPHLKELNVHGTGLSKDEIAAFRAAYPQIKVTD